MAKIVIIGAGHVGAHCAFALTLAGVGEEIVLLDIDRRKAAAQALDVSDAAAQLPHGTRVRDGWYDECEDADIAVLAAGAPRAMQVNARGETVAPSRLSLMEESVRMLADIVPRLKASGFNGVLISMTNPCDVVAQCLYARMDLPAARVFGTGTGLDTARLTAQLSRAYGLPAAALSCLVMGEHGDSQVAPVSQARIPAPAGVDADAFASAANSTRAQGAAIIGGKGSTEFGIGTVLMRTARAVLLNERIVLPVSALLTGQYGQENVYAGVPAIIGRGGIERILELPLTQPEQAEFAHSCDVIRKFTQEADRIYPRKGEA